MIAYDELVVALTNWRAAQGLPTAAVNFLAPSTGSVDLALPVADPVEMLQTSEVEALADGDYDEAYGDEINVDGEEIVTSENYSQDPAAEFASTEPTTDEYREVEHAESEFEEPTAFGGSDAPSALEYEEETQYSTTPSMDDELADQAEEVSMDGGDEQAVDLAAASFEEADAEEPLDGAGEESFAALDESDDAPMQAEADPVDDATPALSSDDDDDVEMSMDDDEEEFAADGMDIEEEIDAGSSDPQTEEVTVLAPEHDQGFSDLEGESTVLGIGVDEVGPGPDDDSEDR